MSARSERFNASMVSVDWVDEEFDPSKDPRQSDGGVGVERMLDALDFDPLQELVEDAVRSVFRQAALSAAAKMVVASGEEKSLLTLELIVENGKERDYSIWEIVKRQKRSSRRRKRVRGKPRKGITNAIATAC